MFMSSVYQNPRLAAAYSVPIYTHNASMNKYTVCKNMASVKRQEPLLTGSFELVACLFREHRTVQVAVFGMGYFRDKMPRVLC